MAAPPKAIGIGFSELRFISEGVIDFKSSEEQISAMHLITTAHLGEAQSIIEDFQLIKKSPFFFQNEELSCLITGEGPFEAAVRTSSALATGKYSSVINLGICGSLSDEAELGEIYSIRTCYLVIDGRPQFKSFPACPGGKDLITSFERILNPDKASALSGVGELVDREAWGVAMAAKEQGVKFFCHKLVSDRAGTLGACELVRENVLDYSQKLSSFLKETLSSAQNSQDGTPMLENGFHFTFSSRKLLESLLRKLSIRDEKTEVEILQSLDVSELMALKISSKERSRLLIEKLERQLDPFKGQLHDQVKSWKSGLEREGLMISTDSSWESPLVKISFEVASPADVSEKIKVLKKLDLETFYRLRRGELNVE